MISKIEERMKEHIAEISEAMLSEIREAAQKILSGELVGFPTETVYGL
jgi:tRNA A37 threonylcarbamoyladenosine synthetase subunit TsaC/SUA5/YrdC